MNDMQKDNKGGKRYFVPELIDIICPIEYKACDSTSTNTSNEHMQKLKRKTKNVYLSQICLVLEYVESDFDQLLKNPVAFS